MAASRLMRRCGPGTGGTSQDLPETEWNGALAQLGERYNGIVEVSGSIPLGSTIHPFNAAFEVRGQKLSFTLADEVSSAGVLAFRAFSGLGSGQTRTGSE